MAKRYSPYELKKPGEDDEEGYTRDQGIIDTPEQIAQRNIIKVDNLQRKSAQNTTKKTTKLNITAPRPPIFSQQPKEIQSDQKQGKTTDQVEKKQEVSIIHETQLRRTESIKILELGLQSEAMKNQLQEVDLNKKKQAEQAQQEKCILNTEQPNIFKKVRRGLSLFVPSENKEEQNNLNIPHPKQPSEPKSPQLFPKSKETTREELLQNFSKEPIKASQ